MRRTRHLLLVSSLRFSLKNCYPSLGRKKWLHASRTPSFKTVSQASFPQMQMTRPRRASRLISSLRLVWVCLLKVCASGSRTRRRNRSRFLSQRAIAKTRGVYQVTRRTLHAATHALQAGAGAGVGVGVAVALPPGDDASRDPLRGGDHTREVPPQIASASLLAKHAPVHFQTHVLGPPCPVKGETTRQATLPHALHHALAPALPHPNAAVAALQTLCQGVHH